jgi:hypothetical protein
MKLPTGVFLLPLLATALCAAQPASQRDGHEDRRPPHDHRDEGPRGDRPDGPPNRPPRPGPFEQMRNYLELVDRYSKLSADPTSTAVAAVITMTDILRPRGPQAVIEKLEKMLPEAKNVTVERAIRLQLSDFYRQTNQPEKAIEQLDALIKAAPAQ